MLDFNRHGKVRTREENRSSLADFCIRRKKRRKDFCTFTGGCKCKCDLVCLTEGDCCEDFGEMCLQDFLGIIPAKHEMVRIGLQSIGMLWVCAILLYALAVLFVVNIHPRLLDFASLQDESLRNRKSASAKAAVRARGGTLTKPALQETELEGNNMQEERSHIIISESNVSYPQPGPGDNRFSSGTILAKSGHVILAFLKAARAGRADQEVFLRCSVFGIRFKNADLEYLWNNRKRSALIQLGAKTLAFVTVFLMAFIVLRTFFIRNNACIRDTHWTWGVVQITILMRAGYSCFYCWIHPDEHLYWKIMCFFFFFIPAMNIAPFNWSCSDLHAVIGTSECGLDGDLYPSLKEAAEHVDCSLHGLTATQLLMTWILLQQRLMPRLQDMQAVWWWIIVVYCGWSFVEYIVYKSIVFGTAEIWYRVGLLLLTQCVAVLGKYHLEKSARMKYFQDLQQRETNKNMFRILRCMVPVHVIKPMLRDRAATIAFVVPRVSILFILIDDFDRLLGSKTPSQLLAFLNGQFTQLDRICTHRRVTKIETIGEEYVACVGVLPGDQKEDETYGHGFILQRLFDAAAEIFQVPQAEKVSFKMGVHTGPIVAGVIGKKLPRYRLFGDTINTAARFMQKGLPGKLQLGEETFRQLPSSLQEKVKSRGMVDMKGKGLVEAYTFEPGPRASVAKTDSTFTGLGTEYHTSWTISDFYPSASKNIELEEHDQDGDEAERSNGAFEPPPPKRGWLDWRHCILNEAEIFNPEMEKEWFRTFHLERISQDIIRRFASEMMVVMLLSAVELYHMVSWRVWIYPHPVYYPEYRVAVFSFCRISVIMLYNIWIYVASASTFVQTHALTSQVLLFLSTLTVIVLIRISYDALTVTNTQVFREVSNMKDRFTAPQDEVWTLNFVLIFFLSMRRRVLLFWSSVCFLPVCLFIIYLQLLYERFELWQFAWWPVPTYRWGDQTGDLPFREQQRLPWEPAESQAALLLTVGQTIMNIGIALVEEQNHRARYKTQRHLEAAQERIKDILETLLPHLVVNQLRSDMELPSHQYRHATIATSDLCGFTLFCSTKTPFEVVHFMDRLFGVFDALTDKYEVYKVETVGDAYIAGMAEQPLTEKNLPANVVMFGLDMVRAVDDWARELSVAVTCRVGVHYGECIGGIVGTDMQRYHIFGAFLPLLDILESTSIEGRVQVSTACKNEVERQLLDNPGPYREEITFVPREEQCLTTSKGDIHAFDEVGGRTYLVESNFPLRRLPTGPFVGVLSNRPDGMNFARATTGRPPQRGKAASQDAGSEPDLDPAAFAYQDDDVKVAAFRTL